MSTPHELAKRAQKLARQEKFLTLQAAVKAQPLTANDQVRLLERIMQAVVVGDITAAESRALTDLLGKVTKQR